jgi:hypothetical protein
LSPVVVERDIGAITNRLSLVFKEPFNALESATSHAHDRLLARSQGRTAMKLCAFGIALATLFTGVAAQAQTRPG